MPLISASLLLYSKYAMDKTFKTFISKYQLDQLTDHQLMNFGALGLANEFERAAVESPMNYQNMQYNI